MRLLDAKPSRIEGLERKVLLAIVAATLALGAARAVQLNLKRAAKENKDFAADPLDESRRETTLENLIGGNE